MSVLEDTGRGYPLPHPDNNPRSVDVPRLRQALNLIDEDMTALAGSLDGKADASGVTAEISAAISALLAGAPEAYDTLVEIADKLASNDDVVAGILTSIAAKANIVDVFTRSEMEGALAAKAPLNSPEFVNKVTLPNGRVIDETNLPFEALVRVQRSANTQLVFGNVGSLIDCTGTFTQTFAAPAALKNGWWCYIRNSGTGDITIPASDGRTNWVMYPGEMRLFQCDGIVLRSVIICPFHKKFQISGEFIKPPGYAFFGAAMCGGGGGGGGGQYNTNNSLVYNGGQGGGSRLLIFNPIDPTALANSSPVVVGAGGAPGVSGTSASKGGTSGQDGGTSTFLDASALGGGGGRGSVDVHGADGIVPPLVDGFLLPFVGGIREQTGRIDRGYGGTRGIGRGEPGGNTTPPGAGAAGELRIWGIV